MKKYRKEKDCLNCGTTVEDNFCPHCGQENIETKEPFLGFLIHGIAHYFHFDSKFQKSIVPLITQPGKLTNEYIAGKRASYIQPVNMYLFISLVFFLLFSVDSSFIKTEAAKPSQSSALSSSKKTDVQIGLKDGFFDNTDSGVNAVDMDLGTYTQKQQALPASKQDSWLVEYFTKKAIQLREKYGDELQEKILETVQHQLPKMMFILMPLFALILSISFYRSRLYFIEHLIYTLHVHSFLFLLNIMIELVNNLSEKVGEYVFGIGIIISIWYIYRSMREVYKKSKAHTLLKFILLGTIYMLLMVMSFTAILVLSVASL
jgi:hypothetical protein